MVVTLALAVAACAGDGGGRGDGAVTLPPEPIPSTTSTTSAAPTTPTTPTPEGATESAPPPTSTSTSAATAPTTSAPTTTAAATSTGPTTTTDPTVLPSVDAAAHVVYDMRSGQRLAAQDADAQHAVGSLMKLLTAQVAFNAGQPTKIVIAPDRGLLIDQEESSIGIFGGQELPRDLLIRAMLKVSANDAARLLALDIAGSEAAYAEQMNATAAALGLANTNAVNVTGLDADGQYSSAGDITALGVHLMGNITFQQTVKESTAMLNEQTFRNTNDLLTMYPGADGIKTGHTTDAGWCILASATRDGRRIVVAVLGAPTEDARNASATALLDWGFTQP